MNDARRTLGRIAIVDDDAELLAQLVWALKGEFEVVTAGDGVRHTYSSIVQAVGGEANIILGNYDPALLTSYEAFTARWKRVFNIT